MFYFTFFGKKYNQITLAKNKTREAKKVLYATSAWPSKALLSEVYNNHI